MVGVLAALGLYFVGLAAYNQLSGLASDVPAFKENLSGFITSVTDRIENLENATSRLLVPARKAEPAPVPQPTPPRSRKNRKEPVPPQIPLSVPGPVAVPGAIVPAIPEVRIHEDRNPIADYVYARLGTVYEFLLMASFVPFLVYFMLSWRDHIQRSFLRFFEGARPGRGGAQPRRSGRNGPRFRGGKLPDRPVPGGGELGGIRDAAHSVSVSRRYFSAAFSALCLMLECRSRFCRRLWRRWQAASPVP